jgi:glycosyltransferase involved in cell wall biosynthesis
LRVVRVITRLNRGGPARTLLAVEPELRARGIESLLLAGEPDAGEDDLTDDFRAAGIRVERIAGLRRAPRPFADAQVRRALERTIASFRPDVVHSHTFKAGYLARTARLDPAIRRVHTFHGHLFRGAFPPPFGRALALLERRLARATDRVIAVSEQVRRDLCDVWRVAPQDSVDVVPGVLLPEMAAPPTESERADARARLLPAVGPWVGTLARLAAVKAPDFFLDVAQAVAARRADVRFVWIGDGERRDRFLAEIARRRLSERVRFVGWQGDVRGWHLALDLEVLLSDAEGLPLSLLEATALRVPVVATAVGGVPDLVRDGIDGRLVAPRAREAAADAIVELLARPLPEHAPPPLRGLAPADHARRLIACYERALAGPARAA